MSAAVDPEVPPPADRSREPQPPAGTVPFSAPCAKCEYDLLYQPLDGRCPECGCPVQDSLGGSSLHYLTPASRRRLMAGLVLVALTPPLITVAHIGAAWLMTFLSERAAPAEAEGIQPQVLTAAAGLASLLGVTAVLLVAARLKPARLSVSPRLRLLTVAAAAITGTSYFLFWPIVWLTSDSGAPPWTFNVVRAIFLTTLGGYLLTGTLLASLVGKLASRMPRSLSRWPLGGAGAAFATSLVLAGLIWLIWLIYGRRGLADDATAWGRYAQPLATLAGLLGTLLMSLGAAWCFVSLSRLPRPAVVLNDDELQRLLAGESTVDQTPTDRALTPPARIPPRRSPPP